MWISRVIALLVLTASAGQAAEECAPRAAIEAYEAGASRIAAGDVQAGIAKLEQAVSIYPDFRQAYEKLEHTYWKTGAFAKAIEAAEQQIRLLPAMAEAHEYSIQWYRRLLATPESARKALARSELYERGSNEAIAACKEAIDIHPAFVEAHAELARHYIHADDEAAAKKQVVEIAALRAPIWAGFLVDAIRHYKPEWLTEEYGEELSAVFARYSPEDDKSLEASEPTFSSEEVSELLLAYEKQISAIRSLIDEHSDMRAAWTMYNESSDIQEQLRSLSFLSISGETGGPEDPPYYTHDFFKAMTYTPGCSIGKIARSLNIPGKRAADWRMGLCHVWMHRPYCHPRCVPQLEFRIETEMEGRPYHLTARVRSVEGVLQCVDQFGERNLWDW